MDLNTTVQYKSWTLVTTGGKGVAWPGDFAKAAGISRISVELAQPSDLVALLKSKVDAAIEEHHSELRKTLPARHDAWLKQAGVPFQGRKAFSLRNRTASCHNCRYELTGNDMARCLGCAMMICIQCGACGCGTIWGKRTPKVQAVI
jgi:hypothetical protein